MSKRFLLPAGILIVAVSQLNVIAQDPRASTVQLPKTFEFFYETGPGFPGKNDTFDSEKNIRVVAAANGMVTYTASLTDAERMQIYEAIVKYDIPAVKSDFTRLGSIRIDPETVGRLRLDIDGQVKDIPFTMNYCIAEAKPNSASEVTADTPTDDLLVFLKRLGASCAPDPEWTRFKNFLSVVDTILKAKDDKQHISHVMRF